MKRIFAAVLLAVVAAAAHGQVSNPSIVQVTSAPSSCPVLPMYYIGASNALYAGTGSGNTCQQVNAGGGGPKGTFSIKNRGQ